MRRLVLSLCLLLIGSTPALAHDFNWKNLLMASLKMRDGLDYDANVDSYMEVFRPDVWKRYKNDEFELAGKRKETVALMKSAIDRFSLEETFVLRTQTQFGTYDFDKQQFPVTGWDETSYYYQYGYPHGGFPSSIRVFFKNPQALSAMPLPEDAAREFLRTRKDKYGNVNRTLYVKLYLRMIEVKGGPSELLAEIYAARVYSDPKYTVQIYEFTTATSESAAR